MSELWNLFVAFLRANILGYGGGPATIPLVEAEVVDRFQWMTGQEFADVLAMGNALPGPIATKMAAFIGFKVSGWTGAVTALVATVGPTFLAMTLGAGLLYRYRDVPFIKGMITGVRPIVWVLFLMLVLDYIKFVSVSWIPAVIAAVAFVALYFAHLNPAIVVLGGLIAGGIFLR